jgi:capsular exopolysaccharide synthesis family protein
VTEELNQENAFQLKDLWDVILKRKWVIVTFFTVLLVVVLIGTLNQTPIYRASTTIAILPDTPKVLSFQEVQDIGSSNYFLYQDYYNTQHKILKSTTIARLTIDRLGLTQIGPGGKKVVMRPDTLIRDLEVEPIKESQLVKVSFNHPDPKLAELIVNTIAQVYLEENLNQRVDVTKQAVDFLSQRLTELKNQVVNSENEVFKFKSANNIVGWEDKHNLVLQKLIDLNTAFSKTHTERIELEARANRLDRLVKSGSNSEALLSVLQSQLIQQLKEKLIDLQREKSELAERYKEEHPKMVRIDSQIQFVGTQIDQEVAKVLSSARHEYELKKAEEDSLAVELETAKKEAMALNQKMISHSALQQEAQKNQELYDILLGRLKETDITSNLKANNLRIIDPAELPQVPIKPQVGVNLALALLIGLVGGIGLAFFFEYIDNTIKTQDDVERYLRLPLLGVIPSIEPGAEALNRDMYVHTHPKSTIAESWRAVRTSLQFMGAAQALPTMLVTSATPLEGKSTTVCNIGITLAQAGHRVALIDTDLRRSRLHKTFHLANERGFSNLLMGANDVMGVAQETGIPNLWVIPSGPLPPNPSELLGSKRMDEVMQLLEANFDRVIFDSPPIIAVTDAIVISRKVAGTIYVIKSGKVSRELAAEARRRLMDVNTNVLGIILNDVDVSTGMYGYQYTYYYGEEEKPPALQGQSVEEEAPRKAA